MNDPITHATDTPEAWGPVYAMTGPPVEATDAIGRRVVEADEQAIRDCLQGAGVRAEDLAAHGEISWATADRVLVSALARRTEGGHWLLHAEGALRALADRGAFRAGSPLLARAVRGSRDPAMARVLAPLPLWQSVDVVGFILTGHWRDAGLLAIVAQDPQWGPPVWQALLSQMGPSAIPHIARHPGGCALPEVRTAILDDIGRRPELLPLVLPYVEPAEFRPLWDRCLSIGVALPSWLIPALPATHVAQLTEADALSLLGATGASLREAGFLLVARLTPDPTDSDDSDPR